MATNKSAPWRAPPALVALANSMRSTVPPRTAEALAQEARVGLAPAVATELLVGVGEAHPAPPPSAKVASAPDPRRRAASEASGPTVAPAPPPSALVESPSAVAAAVATPPALPSPPPRPAGPVAQPASDRLSVALMLQTPTVGFVIGPGGRKVNEMEQATGAQIVIVQKKESLGGGSLWQSLTLSGPAECCAIAEQLIRAKLAELDRLKRGDWLRETERLRGAGRPGAADALAAPALNELLGEEEWLRREGLGRQRLSDPLPAGAVPRAFAPAPAPRAMLAGESIVAAAARRMGFAMSDTYAAAGGGAWQGGGMGGGMGMGMGGMGGGMGMGMGGGAQFAARGGGGGGGGGGGHDGGGVDARGGARRDVERGARERDDSAARGRADGGSSDRKLAKALAAKERELQQLREQLAGGGGARRSRKSAAVRSSSSSDSRGSSASDSRSPSPAKRKSKKGGARASSAKRSRAAASPQSGSESDSRSPSRSLRRRRRRERSATPEPRAAAPPQQPSVGGGGHGGFLPAAPPFAAGADGAGAVARQALMVPNHVAGALIGKGGLVIRAIEERSGCKVLIAKKDSASEGQPGMRAVSLVGTAEQVAVAAELVDGVMRSGTYDGNLHGLGPAAPGGFAAGALGGGQQQWMGGRGAPMPMQQMGHGLPPGYPPGMGGMGPQMGGMGLPRWMGGGFPPS